MTKVHSLAPRRPSILVSEKIIAHLYRDSEGNFQFTHLVNDETAPAENFATNVGHFANAVGQVDILNVDTDTAVLEDVDFGATQVALSYPGC